MPAMPGDRPIELSDIAQRIEDLKEVFEDRVDRLERSMEAADLASVSSFMRGVNEQLGGIAKQLEALLEAGAKRDLEIRSIAKRLDELQQDFGELPCKRRNGSVLPPHIGECPA